MGTKDSGVMMEHLDRTASGETKEPQERKENKEPVETEDQEEIWVTQDLVEIRAERVHLEPMESLVTSAGRGLQDTEEMRAPPDQRAPKDQEESKELLETEARSETGEKMGHQEMELKVAMVSRVTPAHEGALESRAGRELRDPKEMTESLETLAWTTTPQDSQGTKEPKVTEDLKETRDQLGLPDLQELMIVRFWISS